MGWDAMGMTRRGERRRGDDASTCAGVPPDGIVGSAARIASLTPSMAACGRTDGALSICPSSRRHIAVALVVQPVMHPVGTVLTSVQVTGEWLHTSSFDSIISMRNCVTVILPILPIAAILPV